MIIKQNAIETERKKVIQKKITESLGELPGNRRVILERELEKERRLLLKEAKEEIWKKWRQKKGRSSTNPKLITREDKLSLEEKLKRIELEVARYKEDKEKKQTEDRHKGKNHAEDETEERRLRLAKKRRMESYWERLRWVTKFLEETNIIQTEIKRKIREDTDGEGRKKTWEEKTIDQKIETL